MGEEDLSESLPTFWAMVDKEMSEAQEVVLKKHGLTWSTFVKLEQDVTKMIPVGQFKTEFGTIQRYDVPTYIHHNSESMGITPRIRLNRREG